MSDGVKHMYEAAHIAGVERIKNKDPEELYLLLKDLQNDIQHLSYDDSLQLTRNQWSTLSRIQAVVKDLMK
jgi:hypothetical protein